MERVNGQAGGQVGIACDAMDKVGDVVASLETERQVKDGIRAGTMGFGDYRNVGEIIIIRFKRQRKDEIGRGSLEIGGCRNDVEIIRINRQMKDGMGAGSSEIRE